MKRVMETQRLFLREIEETDFNDLCIILQDAEVMYAWEHAFSDDEVKNWIAENLRRYQEHGFSYYAVIEKQSGVLIGVAGVLLEKADNEEYVGIGYIFAKAYWRSGYAFESASACMDYAFSVLKSKEVTAQIRPNNTSSINVAQKLGMKPKKEFIKFYNGKEMPHILYSKTSEILKEDIK